MTVIPPDDRVSAYLDGELDTAERREVEGLLATSEDWRAAVAEEAAARDAVRALPLREAPPGFWESLRARPELAAGAEAPVAAPPPAPLAPVTPLRRRMAMRWAPAAAAVAAAAIAALVVPSVAVERSVVERPSGLRLEDPDEPRPERREVVSETDDDDGPVEDVVDFLLDPFSW